MTTFGPLILEAALKGTLLLAAVTVLIFFVRRTSAARRYAIWFCALAGMLLLPAVIQLLPGLKIIPRAEVLAVAVAPVMPEERTVSRAASTGLEPAEPPFAAGEKSEGSAGLTMRAEAEGNLTPLSMGLRGVHPGDAREEAVVREGFVDWERLLVLFSWVWLAGAVIAAAPLLFGYIGIRRLACGAETIDSGREVESLKEAKQELGLRRPTRLLKGSRGAMPMTCGVGLISPAMILLPAEAVEWSSERLRAVLLHELAHVRRRDCLTQFLTRLACAIYWFHPWVWIAAGRLLVERERACDDVVLRHSGAASAYARDLVEVAGAAAPATPVARAAIAMARPHKLDSRLRAILDRGRNRAGLSRRALAFFVALSALVVLPLASLQWAAPGASEGQGTLQLFVVDARTGAPLPDARIRVIDTRGEREISAGADGSALIDIPSDELPIFAVAAEADGFVPMRVTWKSEPVRETVPSSFTLDLPPGTPIGGRVVDDAGEPVPGANVVLNVDARTGDPKVSVDLTHATVQADAAGHWKHPAVPERLERITIGVHHPDYASHQPGAGWYPMNAYEPVSALRDGSARHLLRRGVSLEGVVLDASGEPAAGATIGIGPDRVASNVLPAFRTGNDGRFRLPLHPDENLVLTVQFSNHAPERLRLPAGELPEELRVQLSSGNRIAGRVVGPEGGAIAGAVVYVQGERGARTINIDLKSDADGRFEWSDAPAEAVTATILAPGFTARDDVLLEPGEENLIEMHRIPVVRGQVVDAENGEPIRRFSVAKGDVWQERSPTSWQREDSQELTRDGGRFEFRVDTSAPRYAVRVEADGYQAAESEIFAVSQGDQEVSFELALAENIRGRVIGVDGSPVARAEVVLVSPASPVRMYNGYLPDHERRRSGKATTDREGRFSFPPREEPFLLVVADESGYGDLLSGDLAESGDLVLHPWGRIEGEARIGETAASGSDIFAQYLLVGETPGSTLLYFTYELRSTADTQGRFRFNRVPPGEVRLGRWLRTDERVLHPNQTRVQVEPGETARMRVGGNGREVVGRILLEGLDDIDWRATRGTVSERRDLRPAVPEDAEEMSVEERVEWHQEWLKTEEGRAFRRARDRANIEGFSHKNVVVEPDGSFRIKDLPPGEYSLRVSFFNREPAHGRRNVGFVNHDFTVLESEAVDPEQPVELPVLEVSPVAGG